MLLLTSDSQNCLKLLVDNFPEAVMELQISCSNNHGHSPVYNAI